MSAVGTLELIVPKSAIDSNGHVNNVHYVQWMQDAAMAHSASLGWSQDRFSEIGKTWIIRSHTIEYRHSAYVGEQIRIFTWVSSFKKFRSLRKYKFYRSQDDTILATASTMFIFCDLNSGKPTTIPQEVQQAYPLVPEDQEP